MPSVVDEAVSFYAGSLEGLDGSGDGVLFYDLADRYAEHFKTAGRNGNSASGTAKVNLDLLELVDSASAHIVTADCKGVRDDTTLIVQGMTIPLIQGTLRNTYSTSVGGQDGEKEEAESAIFAAAVLPFVAACNATDADTIYENTKTGQTNVDFQAVKMAFENNYDCMGIIGDDVGGLWDPETKSYFEGAEPAGFSDLDDSSSGIIGITACFMLGLASLINLMI